MKILPFLLRGAAEIVNRLPLERFMVKPEDTKARRDELQEILGNLKSSQTSSIPGIMEPRRQPTARTHIEHLAGESPSPVSTEETVAYQNREVAKLLLRMQRHYAQKMRIAGKPCDCGASNHLLDIEAMAEETIPMVDDPAIYYRIISWVQHCGPRSTEESAKSGRYDGEYPAMAHEARDFRKELVGTLDPKALWPESRISIEDIFSHQDQEDAGQAGIFEEVSIEEEEVS